ncbi:hypothetical protein JTB14_006320 [Gonioctena quinquepunctata]|nr:hypothetical protein JTB14_006320 [Gonioctena quinquepunctata]
MRRLSLAKPNLNSFGKLTLAVIEYDNTFHSATKHKPFFTTSFNNTYEHIEYEVNTVNQKCRSLSPQKRTKRTLIAPLGSLVKFISGNLDEQDAK